MSRIYTTKQGEWLDMICRREYGDESGFVEQVLAVNPGLADLPPKLPLGTVIRLPELTRADATPSVISLWD
ncbi:tail protein X [Ochrobactrum sp. GPK 3]